MKDLNAILQNTDTYIDTPEKSDGVLRRSEAKEKDMFVSGDLIYPNYIHQP
jgi:hypothetical protein